MARLFMLLFVLYLCLNACGDMSPTPNSTVQPVAQATLTIKPSPTTAVNAPTSSVGTTPGSPQDEDNIREALLRYRFTEVAASQASFPDSKYYCLGIETTMRSASNLQDPTQALLDRFQGNNPPVVKASECDMVGDNMDSKKVIFKSSGEQAIFWGLGSVSWSGNNKASLELSYLYGFNGTGGSIFRLERQNGTWKVTGSTLTWIA